MGITTSKSWQLTWQMNPPSSRQLPQNQAGTTFHVKLFPMLNSLFEVCQNWNPVIWLKEERLRQDYTLK